MCQTRTIASKDTFYFKSSVFVLAPQEFPAGPWKSWTLGPLWDFQGTSPKRRVPSGLKVLVLALTLLNISQ